MSVTALQFAVVNYLKEIIFYIFVFYLSFRFANIRNIFEYNSISCLLVAGKRFIFQSTSKLLANYKIKFDF